MPIPRRDLGVADALEHPQHRERAMRFGAQLAPRQRPELGQGRLIGRDRRSSGHDRVSADPRSTDERQSQTQGCVV
jgi:hypothetical protein